MAVTLFEEHAPLRREGSPRHQLTARAPPLIGCRQRATCRRTPAKGSASSTDTTYWNLKRCKNLCALLVGGRPCSKRAEIIAAIANYEKRLAQVRADLAHITAAITIFEASGDVEEIPPYVDIHRCFKRGEAINLCKEALASGPLNTRQLALRVMAAKGLDTGDKILAKAVAARLIHALRQQCRRGLIDGTEKHLGARIWTLPT